MKLIHASETVTKLYGHFCMSHCCRYIMGAPIYLASGSVPITAYEHCLILCILIFKL